ncbi:MAG: ribose-phosphate pyrophosphokinase [Epsilonproteobacteria bacterium]|nr:ribose-phosphate pyrophosphokinase [Campylobacterota bacterium]
MHHNLVVALHNTRLATGLADALQSDLAICSAGIFPNTEVFLHEPTISLEHSYQHALVLHQFSIHHEQALSMNDQIIQLIWLIDALKQNNIDNITLALPYLPYSRQDKTWYTPHGVLPALGKLLAYAGVKKLITCDLHNPDQTYMPLTLTHIEMADFWANTIKQHFPDTAQMCIAAPDLGGDQRAEKIATQLGLETITIIKKRTQQTLTQEFFGDVSGRNIVLVDDILDTAQTAISACNLLKEHGAQKVYGCFSHAIFSCNAKELIEHSAFDHIFVADTSLAQLSLATEKVTTICAAQFLTEQICAHLDRTIQPSTQAKQYDQKFSAL